MAPQDKDFQYAMNQGHSAAWDQDWEKAGGFYRKAIESAPSNLQAINSLGLAMFQMQRYEEARACYVQAAKISPGDPLPVEKLALIFERIGNLQQAAEFSMVAADLHLKIKDPDKAIENWTRIVRITPEHVKAHSRLAIVYERMGLTEQSIREYISVAALLQNIGQIGEALRTVERAYNLDPDNTEAKQALELVQANHTLPKPKRQPGSTGPLRMAAVREMEDPATATSTDLGQSSPDPIGEARQKALTAIAGLLFDVTSEDIDEKNIQTKGLFKSKGGIEEIDFSKISLHLGKAIDLQTRAENAKAAIELKNAIDSGLNFPAAYFNLGLVNYVINRRESAIRYLSRSIAHPDFVIASRLMIGAELKARGEAKDAAVEYFEALKEADASVVDPKFSEDLRDQYEPLIESLAREDDPEKLSNLCDNVESMLMRQNWRKHLFHAREQMPSAGVEGLVMPIAEMLTETSKTDIVEAIARINQYARQGHFSTAMEEAYRVMSYAPTYLPLHIQMGELLIQQNSTKEAIAKFTAVAQSYAVRGESKRSTNLLRRVVEISPMDFHARGRLILRLIDQGQLDEAIEENIQMADVYYRMAQFDQSRSAYEGALRLAQQHNADREWSIRILRHMADIDMQRLDWRQAARVFEQLRTLMPEDEVSRMNLINIHMRLGKESQATTELDTYISYLKSNGIEDRIIAFLEDLIKENLDMIFAYRRLAEQYQQFGEIQKSVAIWDKVAEKLIHGGDIEGAKQAIRAILVMNPPNAEKYRIALQKLA